MYIEMPTPCIHCGDIFDLNDGWPSDKWYKNTTICDKCYQEEKEEIERDEELEHWLEVKENAEYDLREAKASLKKLNYDPKVDLL